MARVKRSWVAVGLFLVVAGPLRGQCREWGTFPASGADDWVGSMYVWDDGGGPALYLGGGFRTIAATSANHVARWDGTSWSKLSGGLGEGVGSSASHYVESLHAFDHGTGPALYVGGRFNTIGTSTSAENIARWDGSEWSLLGTGLGPVNLSPRFARDMVVFDDGGGDDLYVGGSFREAGGIAVDNLARWDGTSWSALPGATFSAFVHELEVYDGGSGEELYVAGSFTVGLGSPTSYIARWDGNAWSPLGTGLDGSVKSMVVHDEGGGAQLYVAGRFSVAGGVAANRVAVWDGSSWSGLGTGPDMDTAEDLLWFDDGSGGGPQLYAVGDYTFGYPGVGQRHVARWDGSTWTEVGGGADDTALVLASFDAGQGQRLFMGGEFDSAGSVFQPHLAIWDGGSWGTVFDGPGSQSAVDTGVVFDDGGGPLLYADVDATLEGERVMSWDGASWTPVGDVPDDDVEVLHVHDDGSGPSLYVGGHFVDIGATEVKRIARWNGASWEPLGAGVQGGGNAHVAAMASWNPGPGPLLVAAGRFKNAGGVSLDKVATWDGTSWAALGGTFDANIQSLGVFDSGSGPELYVGGGFQNVSGISAKFIARWDGNAWAPLPNATNNGVGNNVLDMQVWDDGNGSALFIGGMFDLIGAVKSYHVARWDGASWASIGSGTNVLSSDVYALTVYDDGDGEALYAGGGFGSPGVGTARWDGSTWTSLQGGGLGVGAVFDLVAHDDGHGAGLSLFHLGAIAAAGPDPTGNIARWQVACPCPPTPYCTAKVNSQGCTPSIFATGTPSFAASSLRVKASNVLNNKSGLLFWGLQAKAAPFQGGTLCVQAPTRRTPLQDSGGNPPPDDCSGAYSFHFNKSYMNSKGLEPGDTVRAQYWSRDPQSASTTGLTDAIEFTLCP